MSSWQSILKQYQKIMNNVIAKIKAVCYIEQVPTGIKYSEAIDVENAPYSYIETTEKIVDEEEQIIE